MTTNGSWISVSNANKVINSMFMLESGIWEGKCFRQVERKKLHSPFISVSHAWSSSRSALSWKVWMFWGGNFSIVANEERISMHNFRTRVKISTKGENFPSRKDNKSYVMCTSCLKLRSTNSGSNRLLHCIVARNSPLCLLTQSQTEWQQSMMSTFFS